MSARLPTPGGDDGDWGDILNAYLEVSHASDGTLNPGVVGSTQLNSQTQAAIAAASTAVQIGGDIAGTTTSPTVAKLNGITAPGSAPSNGQVLTATSSSATAWQTPPSAAVASVFTRTGVVTAQSGDYTFSQVGASQGLIPTAIKTSAYTANPGDFVPVDASSGGVTITLPTTPADKSRIAIKMINTATSHTVTINSGGSDVFNKSGGSTSATLSLLNQAVIIQYMVSGGIWYVQDDDLPLSQLDSRYVGAPASTTDEQGYVPLVLSPSGTPQWGMPWQFNVIGYGAKGNGKVIGDAVMTSGVATLTSASANFTSGDVGKAIMVNGAAGASATPLITTIATFTNSTTVQLAASATANLSGGAAIYGTDDTAAINAAVSAAATYAEANQYHAQIIFGPYNYCLASGPTQATSPNFNAQIPIPCPNANGSTRKLVIEFIGVGDASDCQYWESSIPNLQGTCLVSMVNSTGQPNGSFGSQSVIGGPSSNSGFTGGFANAKPIIDGITVVCPWNSEQMGFDFRYVGGAYLPSASYQAFASVLGAAPSLGTVPTNGQSVGLYMPLVSNNDDCSVDHFTVEGAYYGVAFSEHFNAQKLNIIYANTSMFVQMPLSSTVVHGASILYASCEVFSYCLYAGGDPGAQFPINIGLLDIENTGIDDIFDPNNSFTGVVHWACYNEAAPTVNGASSLKVVNDRLGPGVWSSPPSAPTNNTTQQNTAWRDAIIYLSATSSISAISVDSTSINITSGANQQVLVPSGHSYKVVYTGTLTTQWVLL